jgi:hemerythrin-like domain-containing protein
MAIQLGAKPLADFTQPIEMMRDCHRRIEHFLDVLRKVVERFGEGELDDEGRRALDVSLDYFANSAPRHTADEERSLFPRMRRSENSDARAVMADLDRLEHDHRRCEACHTLLDQLGRQWLEMGRMEEVQRKSLRSAVDELGAIYGAHIRLEEQQVFVVASHMLSAEQLRQIGKEMKQRRLLTSLGPSDADAFEKHGL